MSLPAFAADEGGSLLDVQSSPVAASQVPSDTFRRSTAQATLHALPAIGLIGFNLWLAIATPVALLFTRLPDLPIIALVVLAVLAVPGTWLSWRIVRQCIAAEREIP